MNASPRFDQHIAVDWSAANSPTRGKDSIWIGQLDEVPLNLPTRQAAMAYIRNVMTGALAAQQRLMIGFDFAFGYPTGTAARLGGASWDDVWALIHDLVEDGPDNHSNRFEVAAALNRKMGLPEGPFWGHPTSHNYETMKPTKDKALFKNFPEWRLSDQHAKGAHSVWKLCYSGAVGSQTLLGIAALEALRRDPVLGPHIAIWPFETGFAADLSKPILITEIFPTSHQDFPQQPYDIRDAQQVAQVAHDLARWDAEGVLADKLTPQNLSATERDAVLREEGWIVGL